MNVLVDTCIWSFALRRDASPENAHHVSELRKLISDHHVQMIGPVRQELLSGIRKKSQFEQLKSHLRAFPDIELEMEDYECAAEFFNTLRAKGIQGSSTDFLICAVSIRREIPIYTVDGDFSLYAKYLSIGLYGGGKNFGIC